MAEIAVVLIIGFVALTLAMRRGLERLRQSVELVVERRSDLGPVSDGIREQGKAIQRSFEHVGTTLEKVKNSLTEIGAAVEPAASEEIARELSEIADALGTLSVDLSGLTGIESSIDGCKDSLDEIGRSLDKISRTLYRPPTPPEWCHRAAETGDAAAQYQLACAYDEGIGVQRDQGEATKWLVAAAEKGHCPSQLALGLKYLQGSGVERDFGRGVAYVRSAAERGLAEAQFKLGQMYWHGLGLSEDRSGAIEWLKLAAEQGYGPAQRYLGKVEIPELMSKVESLKWLIIAYGSEWGMSMSLDDVHMKELMNEYDGLKQGMSPDEVIAAERLADDWRRTRAELA